MNYGPETFVVRMEDDAMVPLLPRGHWAFVDPDEPMAPGLLVAFETADGVLVRRLVEEGGGLILRACDPAWPDIVVTADNETRIRGTVVAIGEGV